MAEKGDRKATKRREKFNVPPNTPLTFLKNKRTFYERSKRANDGDAKRTKSAKRSNDVVMIFVFNMIVNKKKYIIL